MEDTKEKKRAVEANRIIGYLILALLSLVAFGLGGSTYMNIFLMFGFIFSLAIFTFSTDKIDKAKATDLLKYAIPLIVVGIFGSLSNFWITYPGNSISGDFISLFGVLSFFVLGYGIKKCKDIKIEWVIFAILGGLALLVLISTIYGLSRYGFFYLTKYANNTYFYDGVYYSIGSEMKLLDGFKFSEVTIRYGSVYAFMLAASLLTLLFIDLKKNPIMFWVILGEGLIGLLSFVALGNFKPLVYLIPVIILALCIRFIKFNPKFDKKEAITGWVFFGIFAILLLIVFINAIGGVNYFKNIRFIRTLFNNQFLLLPINQIINATFVDSATNALKPLSILFGMNSAAHTSWGSSSNPVQLNSINPNAMEFIMLYEGGILAFLGLCAFFLFVLWGIRKWLREADGVTAVKAFVAIFMFAWVVYMSFNSSVFPYIREKAAYVSPFRRNGLFYLFIFFAGYSATPFWKKKEAGAIQGEHAAKHQEAAKEGSSNEISL